MNRRRGSAFSAEKLVDIVLSALVVGSIIFIAVLFWQSFNAVDTKARNDFRLFSDLLQGTIDESESVTREMLFDLTPLDREFTGRKKYQGVFFAISYQVTPTDELVPFFSDPQPPVGPAGGAGVISSRVARQNLELAASKAEGCDKLDRECLFEFWREHCTVKLNKKETEAPCVCFSKNLPALPLTSVTDAAQEIIDGVVECRTLTVPEDDGFPQYLNILLPVDESYNQALRDVESSANLPHPKALVYTLRKLPDSQCRLADICVRGTWVAR